MIAEEAFEDIAGRWLKTRKRGGKTSEDRLDSVGRSV